MNAGAISAKRRWGSTLFALDARRRLRRAFARCLVSGLQPLRTRLSSGSALVALNHVSFWDGFVLRCLESALRADAYCLMDRDNFEKLSFLRFAGALPIDTRNPKRARLELARAAGLLDRPGRLIFVFPQGEQVPARFPLRFRSGVLRLSELAGVPIVPAGLSYEFLQDPKPEVRISIGEAVTLRGSAVARRRSLEQAVRHELERIDGSLSSPSSDGAADFVSLFRDSPAGLPSGSGLLSLLLARRSS